MSQTNIFCEHTWPYFWTIVDIYIHNITAPGHVNPYGKSESKENKFNVNWISCWKVAIRNLTQHSVTFISALTFNYIIHPIFDKKYSSLDGVYLVFEYILFIDIWYKNIIWKFLESLTRLRLSLSLPSRSCNTMYTKGPIMSLVVHTKTLHNALW